MAIEQKVTVRNALFLDTWGWVAIANREEPRHREVLRFYQAKRGEHARIYTSDYVLDEFITLLFIRVPYGQAVQFVARLLTGVEMDLHRIERINPERFLLAWELRKRFQDKPRI